MSAPCKHCGTSGTCTNGADQLACAACHNGHQLKGLSANAPRNGLPCWVCKGTGLAESFTEKLQNRLVPFISLLIIAATFGVIFYLAFNSNELRSEVLTLAGTLVGSVTGYYFGGKGKQT